FRCLCDPATHAPYPLSLHDALPIWRIVVDAFAAAPDESIDSARDRERVRRALRGISARQRDVLELIAHQNLTLDEAAAVLGIAPDRKSTRLNSSHQIISYAVFCFKK